MQQACSDQKLLKLLKDIRTVEREVRNLAAHEIVGVTRSWIVRRTKFQPETIMDMLCCLAKYAGLHITAENREAYRVMNRKLQDLL